MQIRGRHYATGKPVELTTKNGRIDSVRECNANGDQLPWISPAFFDLQVNGCDGISFNSPKLTIEQIHHVVRKCREHGIGALCPTLVTNSFEALAHGFRTLRSACESDAALSTAMPGFHLEGPYIASEDGPRGAHPKQHVRPPDWDEFSRLQDAAGGRIRLVTLAPEQSGALLFIEKLTRNGVVVSLGHTGASPAVIRDAVRAGAKLSTHLGNGSHAMQPRHENYFLEQLATDELWASIICDGHHLPPSLVRIIARVKSPARLILTCDASSLAGLPVGKYREWDQDFEIVPEGKVIVPGTPFLAGSAVFTDTCVGKAIAMADVSLAEAVNMASSQPRKLLGFDARTLEAGMPDDVIAFDWQPGGEIRVHGS